MARATAREYGRAACEVLDHELLLAGVPGQTEVWMSHGDQVAGDQKGTELFSAPHPARHPRAAEF